MSDENKKLKIYLRSEEEQKEIYNKHKLAFPDKIIVLIIPDKRASISLKKEIYICPQHKTFLDLMIQIRKNIDLKEHEGIYFFVGCNTLVSISADISVLQADYAVEGDFLRITICKENAFGCCL